MFGGDRLSRLGHFSPQFPDAEVLHKGLAHWNHDRLSPAAPTADWREDLDRERMMKRLEGEFVEAFRAHVAPLVAEVPEDPEGFVAWFEALKDHGPGQWDPLFDWLEGAASMEDLKWFLTQEAAGEAGFDDLVAMTQVKMPTRAKLEMARNYWDEMGRGDAKGMHGPMLDRLAAYFELRPEIDTTVPEALALGNMMVALATNRRFAFQAAGALGIIELTAPTRAVHVVEALDRLGVPKKESHYFSLHAILDVKHSQHWNAEILEPLVAEDPRRAAAIAEGALLRLWCGQQCFIRYRREFGLSDLLVS